MTKLEKVIKAVEEAFDLVHSDFIGTDDFNETEWEQNKADALALLKEQEDLGTELTNAVELIHKKNERIEQLNRFVNGFSRDAMPVVRCKDCKHRGNSEKCVLSAISEEKDCPLFILDNRGDWFCADGKQRG